MEAEVVTTADVVLQVEHLHPSRALHMKVTVMMVVVMMIMFSFQPKKLGQINVKWYIKTHILRYVSGC